MTEKKKSRLTLYVSILLVLVAYVIYLQYYHYYSTQLEVVKLGAPRYMKQKANNAIETAQEKYNIKLDGSSESIELVEKIMEQLHGRHQQTPLSDSTIFKESEKWGAYIGEVIKSQMNGEWQYDPKTAARTLQLVENNKKYDFMPTHWCFKRITRGDPEDNVWLNFLYVIVDPNDPSQSEQRKVLESIRQSFDE